MAGSYDRWADDWYDDPPAIVSIGSLGYQPGIGGAIIGLALGIAQLRTLNWKWILATTAGWAVGWPLGWYVGWSILSDLGLIAVFAGIGAIAGGLAGSLQWLVLRQYSRRAAWWPPASAVGWSLGMAIGTGLGGPLGWPLVGAASGAITGLVLLWIL